VTVLLGNNSAGNEIVLSVKAGTDVSLSTLSKLCTAVQLQHVLSKAFGRYTFRILIENFVSKVKNTNKKWILFGVWLKGC
jgi:hypothetical protein